MLVLGQEEHLPANCDLYTCYCSTMPNNTVMVEVKGRCNHTQHDLPKGHTAHACVCQYRVLVIAGQV